MVPVDKLVAFSGIEDRISALLQTICVMVSWDTGKTVKECFGCPWSPPVTKPSAERMANVKWNGIVRIREKTRSTWATSQQGVKAASSSSPSPTNSDRRGLAAGSVGGGGMDRWTGVLHVPLSRGGPPFRVAASLVLSPAKTLAVPCANAILFTGDRVRGSGDPVIERLSDAAYLVRLLAGKLSGEANAWVVDAACFAGSFAVYQELVPSVDAVGDPNRYNPTGFPAAAGVTNILAHCVREIQTLIVKSTMKGSAGGHDPTASLLSYCPPKTIVLGFSKGGVVVNQLVTELACFASQSTKTSVDDSRSSSLLTRNLLVPVSASEFLSSMSEFHYVDVGLNRSGAYITDHAVINEIANYVVHTTKNLCFVLHGTPRQWSDPNRSWIQMEKERMLILLRDEAQRCEGRLVVSEKRYFDGKPRSLLMHFEILEVMDIG
uniref:Uncharacterized protein n=1 Tax=Leersia perrieri TaxID=77586 RepID=A0A0D9VJ18_9ORYZ